MIIKAPFYTYALGRTLYIPITCRSNSRTLPETRGPGFTLSSHTVAALCRFRDLECQNQRWSYWCNWLDTQDINQHLPEALEKVVAIDYNPSIEIILKDEIQGQMERSEWTELRLGGEGEPTLNLSAVEYLSREFSDKITMTVMTNGLTDCASSLKEWGISGVSVAFPTSDPNQYLTLMDPLVDNGHERVCSFVLSALACDLQVELTAIDRPDVNQVKAQELARFLGVETEIRWRPYFP